MLGRNILSMTALSLYRNAVQFGMNLAIAGFITPADYGLVVFTAPFLTLIGMLTDMGLSSAMTRASGISREEAGAAFVISLLVGMGCTLLLALSAFPLQAAIGMAGLAPVMIAMSSVILLSVTASIPRAMLERRLDYRRIARIEAVAVAIGAATGLAAAWYGAGVWSLVLCNVGGQAIRAALLLLAGHQDLALNLRLGRLGPLLSMGGWVLATNLLNFLARSGDNLLIGAALGSAAVGIYGLSYQFMLAPLMALTWPSSAILLATLRDTPLAGERAREMVSGVMSATAIVTVPAMIYLTFGLRFPVQALLSPRWHDVPGIVVWLAPLGALQSIASYNGAVLMIAGRAREQFLLSMANTLVLVTIFVVTLPLGLAVLVKTYAAASGAMCCAFLWMTVSLTGLGWRRLAMVLGPPILASATGLTLVRLATGYALNDALHWALGSLLYGVGVLAGYGLLYHRIRAVLAVLTGRMPGGLT